MGERIVLGLGNSIDYETVWSSEVLERLIVEFGIGRRELDAAPPIASARDLVVSILGFLEAGTGGERSVASLDAVLELADRFEKRIAVGGTSLRAAIAMRKLGYTSALHLVTMNDRLRDTIPRDCPWVCSDEEERFFPHLVFQFPKNARVRAGDISLRSPRANRIIYVNDPRNVEMKISPDLASLASDAEVLLISGLNAMRSSALLADRLETLVDLVRALPPGATVFQEEADFHDTGLGDQVRAALSRHVHIYSLNEDELQGCLGRRLALLDPAEVLGALRDLRRSVPGPTIVVHTGQWALAYGARARRYAASLKAGISMACTRMRLGDDFDRRDYLDTRRRPARQAGAEFCAAISELGRGEVCCLPSIHVDEHAATTVGLGDAFVGGFLPTLLE